MISRSPSKRPSIETILKHPFFTNQKFSNQNFKIEDKERSFRKPSIEESFSTFQKEVSGKSFVTKAVQSLIVPSSFFDFTKTGFLVAPEFYLEDVVDPSNSSDEKKSSHFSKKSSNISNRSAATVTRFVKGQMITGPQFSFQDQSTPKFLNKEFSETQIKAFEVSFNLEEEYPVREDYVEDEANINEKDVENVYSPLGKMYEKLQIGSTLTNSPFLTQNFSSDTDTSVKMRQTIEPQFSFEGSGSTTSRNGPTISVAIRNAIKSHDV